MRSTTSKASEEMGKVLIETFAVNEAVNQVLLETLPAKAWRAKPAGGNGRTIAAIFCHVHNIRRKWVRLSAPHLKLPAELDRATCTQRQARVALAASARACIEMLSQALEPNPRVKKFHRDGWARPWPMGAAAVAYMISHEAHHRGQVCMLAHQLEFPLPGKVTSEMWNWERLSRRCGLAGPR
ncbi:MAG TPA: DinB family protein [Candidatus Acidoferrum sp.]|nr:DinB family protein [Candidatus Acidoferrum sp.]